MQDFKHRIGKFISIFSFALLFLFFVSDMSGTPQYSLLLLGVLGLWWGVQLLRKSSPPGERANRFRLLKSLRAHRQFQDEDPNDHI